MQGPALCISLCMCVFVYDQRTSVCASALLTKANTVAALICSHVSSASPERERKREPAENTHTNTRARTHTNAQLRESGLRWACVWERSHALCFYPPITLNTYSWTHKHTCTRAHARTQSGCVRPLAWIQGDNYRKELFGTECYLIALPLPPLEVKRACWVHVLVCVRTCVRALPWQHWEEGVSQWVL